MGTGFGLRQSVRLCIHELGTVEQSKYVVVLILVVMMDKMQY